MSPIPISHWNQNNVLLKAPNLVGDVVSTLCHRSFSLPVSTQRSQQRIDRAACPTRASCSRASGTAYCGTCACTHTARHRMVPGDFMHVLVDSRVQQHAYRCTSRRVYGTRQRSRQALGGATEEHCGGSPQGLFKLADAVPEQPVQHVFTRETRKRRQGRRGPRRGVTKAAGAGDAQDAWAEEHAARPLRLGLHTALV